MYTDSKFEKLIIEIRRLGQLEEELLEIHTDILRYQALVNEFWVSSETDGVIDLIDRLLCQIRWIADELYGIEHDMIKAYEELSKE